MKKLGLTLITVMVGISCTEKKINNFDLEHLPSDWVKLTEKNEKLVVYNSCDAGNLLLTILKNKNQFELLLHGQQEDYQFEIIRATKVNDTIFLNTEWKNSDEKQEFKFVWTNKKKGTGRWITTYSNGFTLDNVFVVKQKQNHFKTVDQPCRECWGDECDEFEKEERSSYSKTDSVSLPDYYDYQSEVDIYYEKYIDKAYSEKKFNTYFTKDRRVLDSLIKDYEN